MTRFGTQEYELSPSDPSTGSPVLVETSEPEVIVEVDEDAVNVEDDSIPSDGFISDDTDPE